MSASTLAEGAASLCLLVEAEVRASPVEADQPGLLGVQSPRVCLVTLVSL